MLEVNKIIENIDSFTKGLEKRGLPNGAALLDQVIRLDDSRKDLKKKLDETLAQANEKSRAIGKLMQNGKKEEAEEAKAATADLKAKSKSLNDEFAHIEQELKEALYNIPNIPNDLVPGGSSEKDNEIVKTADSTIPSLGEDAYPHWDLIEQYDLVDFKLGNKVTGAGFPFYKKQGARLSRALVNFFLDEALAAGYEEVQPPVLINQDSGYGTGQLPDKEGQMYGIVDSQLFLIPTAEVPITNIYRDEILKEETLPIKHVGYTPCFRREAGSWGAHVRGLNRLHQFDKVEIVQITRPEDSYETLEQMVSHVEKLIQSLNLPYRLLRLCAGDLGFTSAITYDFEVFSAAQKKWLEVSSVSNFETYQTNRLKMRLKKNDGKKVLAHSLNGSALALPRIIAALLENNQTPTGIDLPEVLHPYLGFSRIPKP